MTCRALSCILIEKSCKYRFVLGITLGRFLMRRRREVRARAAILIAIVKQKDREILGGD